MQKYSSYKEWIKLTELEKEKEYLRWDVYAGDGKEILKEAIKELKNKYKLNSFIVEISGGLYHGGLWVINVIVKKGMKERLPSKYQGFSVLKIYR